MAWTEEHLPKLVLLAPSSDTIRTFYKHLLPSLKQSATGNGFIVHKNISLHDNFTQMHELSPMSARGECGMDLDGSLDLTDTSSSFQSSLRSFHQQPISINSGPQGIHGNLVTSSSSSSSSSSFAVINRQPSLPHDVRCNVLEVPFDCGIVDLILSHCLGGKTVILLLLDSALTDIPHEEINNLGFDADGLRPYKEFLQSISAVSGVNGKQYKVILAGYKGLDVSPGTMGNVFNIIRYLANTTEFDMNFYDENLIIGEPSSINRLVDALREAGSEMQETNNCTRSSVGLFTYPENNENPSSAYESREITEITEDQKEKALQVLALIIKEAQRRRLDGSAISSGFAKLAVQSGSDLHESIDNNSDNILANLVRMGCLIPCYNRKGEMERNKYIVHYLTPNERYDLKSQTGSGVQVKHVPVLRIQIEAEGGQLHYLSPLLIPGIVSECLNSWCVARQGKHELISQISVAFSANYNATRLVASIKNDSIFLVVFEYSEMADGKSIDKKLCQQFFQHVEIVVKKLLQMRATLTCSIRCKETDGDLHGENGWMDVDQMNQCDKAYFCTSHDRLQGHYVQLADTLNVWFSNQNEEAQASAVTGEPDSSMDTEHDIPDHALPEIAQCFGDNWNLFFISRGVDSVFIENLIRLPSSTPDKIHEALKQLKRLDKYNGKLSFDEFGMLVTKYKGVSFNFQKYDNLVKKLKG